MSNVAGCGYVVGAIVIGLSMEVPRVDAAFYLTGFVMVVSGLLMYRWMEETHPKFGNHSLRHLPPPEVAVGHPDIRLQVGFIRTSKHPVVWAILISRSTVGSILCAKL